MSDFPCDRVLLGKELEADEGRRYKRYKCPAGKWTVGVGHNLEALGSLSGEVFAMIRKIDPAIGPLLDDEIVLTDAIIDRILDEDIQVAITTLDVIWIGWRALSEERKRALINLSFQMGYHRLKGFVRFWRSIHYHDFERAAAELKNSLWYRQTQESRKSRVVAQIKGKEP